jgi:hypothetical protein
VLGRPALLLWRARNKFLLSSSLYRTRMELASSSSDQRSKPIKNTHLRESFLLAPQAWTKWNQIRDELVEMWQIYKLAIA